ncbi:MAG TPA: hypothetical protein VL992_18600, partial [Tepidisphaeraceae bacterium]|nr:hypothetical protein [Tepidisphaeraceae bacterium]
VYQPHVGEDTATIRSVRAAHVADGPGVAACVVDGDGFNALLAQDDQPAAREIEGCVIHGSFGAIIRHGAEVAELYLGHGQAIGAGDISITAAGDQPIDAGLARAAGGWRYSSSAPIRVHVNSRTFDLPAGLNLPLPPGGKP